MRDPPLKPFVQRYFTHDITTSFSPNLPTVQSYLQHEVDVFWEEERLKLGEEL